MSNLGSFGAAVQELSGSAPKDTFEFFGETFTIVGELPPILMLQLGAAVSGKLDESEMVAAIWEALHWSLDDADEGTEFDRFYKVAVRSRCDMDSLMKLIMALFARQSGRPTEEPQGSMPGRSTTLPSSSISSSPIPVYQEPALPGMTRVDELLRRGSEGFPAA